MLGMLKKSVEIWPCVNYTSAYTQKYVLDAVFEPYAVGPWARYAPLMDRAHAKRRQNPDSVVGGAWLFCGEPYAVEQAARGLKQFVAPRNLLYLNGASLTTKWDASIIRGVSPGYLDSDSAGRGSEFLVAAQKMAEQKGACFFLVENLHLATSEAQELIAEIAKTGVLPSGSGGRISLGTEVVVIATAPGVFAPGHESEVECSPGWFAELLADSDYRRPIFSAAVRDSFAFHQFRRPTAEDFVACASIRLGMELQQYLHGDDFVYPFYAGAELLKEIFDSAGFQPEDGSWKDVCEKFEAALRVIPKKQGEILHDELRPSDIWMMPNRAIRLNGQKWVTNYINLPTKNNTDDPLSKIGDVEVDLPCAFLEASGAPVPSSAFWGDFSGVSDAVKSGIFGQDAAIDDLCRRVSVSLISSSRQAPIYSALLVGPSGSGKTAMAASFSAATGKNLIHCDCANWKDRTSLLQGLFGSGGNSLATMCSRRPDSVILFDEADKADPLFWEVLMGAFDNGVLRDPVSGRNVNVKHCLVFVATNYLSEEIGTFADSIGGDGVKSIDSILRVVLSRGAGIHQACVERIDAIYMMMPLSGKASYPVWEKMMVSGSAGLAVAPGSPRVAEMLETLHVSSGGAKGARARRRLLQSVLAGTAHPELFSLSNTVLDLSSVGETHLKEHPLPIFDRLRLWGSVTDAKARFQQKYKGNSSQVSRIFEDIASASKKVKPRGPVGVFVLAGPTGSGKTFLAEMLSRAFNKGDPVRIDCAQYVGASAVNAALFGTPSGNQGVLTRPLLVKRDRVILMDEFTRADPSFIDQVMTVLDEGIATDASTGLPIDLKESVIFLTTNACENVSADLAAENRSMEDADKALRDAFVQYGLMRREHAERISAFIPLARQPDDADSPLFFAGVISRVAEEFGVSNFDAEALAIDCKEQLGASANARTIERWASGVFAR